MHITIEEEIVLLYALYVCGRRPSKARATHFIMSNALMKEREGDADIVSTRESRVENRIAWIRENLKLHGELSMPDRGTWAITQKGVQRIEKIAVRSLSWEESAHDVSALLHEIQWDRFSDTFLKRLKALGAELKQRQGSKGEQAAGPNAGSANASPTSVG